ncbi:MAG: hypothetical protein K8R69_02615 [Deltaproteobacteria bacterium]|nr:hypothetical protein [Deltaproteobacteria bacterium]
MLNQRFDIASGVLTALPLGLLAVVFLFFEMIALNGAGPKSAYLAFGFLLICQVVTLVSAGIFAGWLAKALVDKRHWRKAPSRLAALSTGILLGGLGFLFSMILSMLFAGIK